MSMATRRCPFLLGSFAVLSCAPGPGRQPAAPELPAAVARTAGARCRGTAPVVEASRDLPAGSCIALPAPLQKALARRFEQQTMGADAKLVVTVAFPCNGLSAAPANVSGAQVFGHGGLARVVGLTKSAGGDFRLRMLRVEQRLVTDAASGATNPVEFVRADVPAAQVSSAFEQMRGALAARIMAEHRPPPGQLELGPLSVSDQSLMLQLRLQDTAGSVAQRSYSGYVGSADAAERVPVEHAWQALAGVWPASEQVSHSPEPEDRALLERVWAQGSAREFYAEDGLLALAIAAGSPVLIGPILKDLQAEAPSTRRLAVAALAAITGWDARVDAAGQPRPLPDAIADYQRECSVQ